MKRDDIWRSMKIFRQFRLSDIVKTAESNENYTKKIIRALKEHNYIKYYSGFGVNKVYVLTIYQGDFPLVCKFCGQNIFTKCKTHLLDNKNEVYKWMMQY